MYTLKVRSSVERRVRASLAVERFPMRRDGFVFLGGSGQTFGEGSGLVFSSGGGVIDTVT